MPVEQLRKKNQGGSFVSTVMDYSNSIGFVDKVDMLKATYKIDRAEKVLFSGKKIALTCERGSRRTKVGYRKDTSQRLRWNRDPMHLPVHSILHRVRSDSQPGCTLLLETL
ncbi:uncharacterized protein LOC116847368 [Odontomachus brunneus]|uniref:uncharacterized protein LOC116847368 n=1 Tax=Odontomachus brunneus TaxID=486640 RepID=UPI0013F1F924|nr:uncharacterized protein LOC116847368 [Odontomachus brunneus]